MNKMAASVEQAKVPMTLDNGESLFSEAQELEKTNPTRSVELYVSFINSVSNDGITLHSLN
jgi:hypothetical protein